MRKNGWKKVFVEIDNAGASISTRLINLSSCDSTREESKRGSRFATTKIIIFVPILKEIGDRLANVLDFRLKIREMMKKLN